MRTFEAISENIIYISLCCPCESHPWMCSVEIIVKKCKEIMSIYRNNIGIVEWNQNTKTIIIPRIVSLIESLPSLAKSGRDSELSYAMKLITGYLTLVVDGKDTSFSKSVLSKYLAHQLTQESIRQCLVGKRTVLSLQ